MTKSFKKCISSPNDGNIVGICNMLQRDEKCMQNSSQKKIKHIGVNWKKILKHLKSIGEWNGLDSSSSG